MMCFGCCKHVLKVYVNLTDKKNKKKRCLPIHLKVDLHSKAPLQSCIHCTAVLKTDRGEEYGSLKFPWGEQKCIWLTAYVIENTRIHF